MFGENVLPTAEKTLYVPGIIEYRQESMVKPVQDLSIFAPKPMSDAGAWIFFSSREKERINGPIKKFGKGISERGRERI